MSFVHLHLHTEYSLLDGANRVDKLVSRVKALGMDSVAITDHGNMHGAASFFQVAKREGIKPILGVEAYVAPGDRRSREPTGVMDGGFHLVLLAENQAGWNNLLYLCSEAYLTGFYYKPRMDREILESHGEGLIAISGHLGSELAYHLVQFEKTGDESHYERACEAARWHASTFRGDADPMTSGFFVELQHHIGLQNSINPHLIRLADDLGLPLVCDNDSHFLLAEDHDAHDTLICISTGKTKADPARMTYPTELYVKSPEEMRTLFVGTYGERGREACDNTVTIASRCEVDLPLGENHAPVVRMKIADDLPECDGTDLTAWYNAYCRCFEVEPFDATTDEADEAALEAECDRALRMLAEAGMVWRYGTSINDDRDDERWARLERELRILSDKNISAYFLIVWDFVNEGRQRGIPANARGSGVGTMVGYVLGLSNACPVRYGLLFERFTDPDRSEYPDIDIDLCQDGRGEVIEYVRRKYGHVAQIITFGTLKPRAAVRDVGRVLEMPLGDVDRIAKLIPEAPGMTFDRAFEEEPDFKTLYAERPEVKRVVDTARVFEGQARHSSVHAAGVIVATRPLHEIVPLYRQSGSAEHEVITQWDGPTCEKMGLLKMDFLGLRTLSVIERAKLLVREGLDEEGIYRAVGRERGDGGDHPLDLERLTFQDQLVFDMFRRGDTTGVFQFESGGMRRLLTEMKPDRLEDLIAANALFRPGPMDLIPDYNRRKHGQDTVPKVHPIVDRFTAETYGVMVYQEQVMQIVHELGGIPLRAAYSLIKAISKKKKDVIDGVRPKFIEGAGEQGLERSKAEELFDLILKFAGYGFNKSHSTGYAIVAYQTAFLKTYFPNQYMAAFLTFESQAQKVSDWIPYLDDCRRTRFIEPTSGRTLKTGVEVKAPDINRSQAEFSVVFENESVESYNGHVRFGMKAIKGAGAKAIEAIVQERETGGPYKSLFEFAERVPPGSVNKATIEALIRSGCFDSVHGRDMRASMIATVEKAVAGGQKLARDKAAGQGALFGGEEATTVTEEPPLVTMDAWSEPETLAQEKETLGFYVSSHPLDQWASWISAFKCTPTNELGQVEQKGRALIGGMVQSVRPIMIRNGKSAGQKMAILTVEDRVGSIDAVLFSDQYAIFAEDVKPDEMLFLIGDVDHSRGDPQLIIDRVIPIDGMPRHPIRWLDVLFDATVHEDIDRRLLEVHTLLKQARGKEPIPLRAFVYFEGAARPVPIPAPNWACTPTPDLMKRLHDLLGPDGYALTGPVLRRDSDRKLGKVRMRRS